MEHLTHPEFYQQGSYAHLPLGRLPHRADPRTLHLEDYIDASALPKIPAACDWTTKVQEWPMYGNDKLGDCTCAAAGHMVQAWSCNAVGCFEPSNDDVVGLYWNTGKEDTGRYEIDVLNYWRQKGLGNDKITAYVSVNARHTKMVRAAIYLFGGVYTGIALPLTAQSQRTWDVVGDGHSGNSQPGSWGGHAVPYHAYDADGVTLVTWGALLRATWRFHLAYTDEVYAIVSPDWLDVHGGSPAGLNMKQLEADLYMVTK